MRSPALNFYENFSAVVGNTRLRQWISARQAKTAHFQKYNLGKYLNTYSNT